MRIEYEGARCSDSRARPPRSWRRAVQIREHQRRAHQRGRRARYRGDTSSELGYRTDFPLNGSLQNWKLVVAAADPTDPNGHVVPLDYNAETNNKHWAKIGGF